MATPGLLINNAWKHPASSTIHTVASPFSGAALGEVVIASESDVDSALEAAVAGAKLWRQTPAHQRAIILLEAARIADTRSEELARIISNEMGKSIREARGEASRAGEILSLIHI